jgi:hypothetical protein
VWSKQFLPALRGELARHGIATTVYGDAPPDACAHRLEYEAEWKWDVAVYLRYADLRVYDGETLAGRATYDARGAFARLDKFGRTEDRLRTLVAALVAGDRSTDADAAARAGGEGSAAPSDRRGATAAPP